MQEGERKKDTQSINRNLSTIDAQRRIRIGIESGTVIERGTGTGPDDGTRIDIDNETAIAIKTDSKISRYRR
ncbi:hypothetical protein EVAR_64791_1 [Eumeta japonica]|uniref:Uncharacterized protein n=1 Tax=Eumeta variegata TaxID=151549 RepID=A0A4C1ZQQ2_EUMVA|nr:hypothetical protein EVAR_64791_1 [Eumeta japonica]